jgi:hypothetical protein
MTAASPKINTNTKTWFITGVSSGFGRALAQEALAAGHRVVGTLRNEAPAPEFEALQPGRSFGRGARRDARRRSCPRGGRRSATVGRIDVLVNNAGYGHEGTVEESSAGRAAPAVRRERVRRGGHGQGGAALHARAAQRPHPQHHLDGRLRHLAGASRYYLRQQVRARGHLGGAGQGGRELRHARDGRRARRLSAPTGPAARWCARRRPSTTTRR